MQAVAQELDLLMAWVSWVSLALCVGGIFLAWIMWKKDINLTDSGKQVLVIVVCAAVISSAVRIATWLV